MISGAGFPGGSSTMTSSAPGAPFGAAQGIGAGLGALGLMAQFFPPTAPIGMGMGMAGGMMGGGYPGQGAGVYSSRGVKTHIDEIEPIRVFEALERLTINIWKYLPEVADKNDDHGAHIGPYAEDFKQLFSIGDGRTLHFIDMLGVAMAATKGAGEKIKVLEERIAKLEELNGHTDEEWPDAPVG